MEEEEWYAVRGKNKIIGLAEKYLGLMWLD